MTFFKLPDSIISVVCCHWSDLKNVGRLDTALTNEEQRVDFLRLLSNRNAAFFVEPAEIGALLERNHVNHTYLSWIEIRGVYFSSFSTNSPAGILKKYSPQDLLKVKRIHFAGWDQNKTDVLALVNSCAALNSIVSRYSLKLSNIDTEILQNLTVLPPVHKKDFPLLAQHCKNLTALTICDAGVNREGEWDEGEDKDETSDSEDESNDVPDNESENDSGDDASEQSNPKSSKIDHFVELMTNNPNLKQLIFEPEESEYDFAMKKVRSDLKRFDLHFLSFMADKGTAQYFLDTFTSATTLVLDSLTDGCEDPEDVYYNCSYDKASETIDIFLRVYDASIGQIIDENEISWGNFTTLKARVRDVNELLIIAQENPNITSLYYLDWDETENFTDGIYEENEDIISKSPHLSIFLNDVMIVDHGVLLSGVDGKMDTDPQQHAEELEDSDQV